MMDLTLILYALTMVVSLYGLILFMWWWAYEGRASSMYIYVTFLFLASLIESSLSFYVRCIGVRGDTEVYLDAVSSWWWPGRTVLTLIILVAITGHLTMRLLKGRE